MTSGKLEVERALAAILERYAAAVARKRELDLDAAVELVTKAEAAAALDSLATEFFVLSHEMGETLLCLLRHAADKQRDELRLLLMELLAPDIGAAVTLVLERRQRR